MKTKTILFFALLSLFLSGCVVYSFYPFYKPADLFANDILIGKWLSADDGEWIFEHPVIGKKGEGKIDSTSYFLKIVDKENEVSEFKVHLVKLGEYYFLDFYLKDFMDGEKLSLASFHSIPVHTFAKLTVSQNGLVINWFDQDWLTGLIESDKLQLSYEKNDDFVLLTANPDELQKFALKYVDLDEAFKNGMNATLIRQ